MKHLPVLLCVLMIAGIGCRNTSDASLIKRFETHRHEFEELITLAPACDSPIHLQGITYSTPDTAPTLPQEKRCVELLKALDLTGLAAYEDEIWLSVDLYKGYVYADSISGPLYSNLDEMPPDLQPYRYGYRHVLGRWYLYHVGPLN